MLAALAIAALWLLNRILKATADALAHSHVTNRLTRWASQRWTGKGPRALFWLRFFGPDGWRNKWRDWRAKDPRPAFPGASTWLVWLTDWWHLANALQTLCVVGMALCAYAVPWHYTLAAFVPGSLAFELVYRWLRRP